MKTIAILIQTEYDETLWPLANKLGKIVDTIIEEEKLLDSWRTPFPYVMDTDIMSVLTKILDFEDKVITKSKKQNNVSV